MEKSDKDKEINSKTEVFQIKHGFWRTYDATDGLLGEPNHLLQDEKGYLWIGTDSGICRYDGLEFVCYTTEHGLPDNCINDLCLDNRGRIWISTPKGLSCYDDELFTNYTINNGLPDNNTGALCLDSQGNLWIGTPNGLSCFDGVGFINYTTAHGLLDNDIVALCPSSRGGIWIGTKAGISRFDGQKITTLTTDINPYPGSASMCEDSHGQLWIAAGHEAKGVYCFDGTQSTNYTNKDGLLDIQNLAYVAYGDSHGNVWFGGWNNVSCFDGERFITLTTDDGLAQVGIFDIMEDSEGQMWFAHGFLSALSSYDPKAIGLLSDHPVRWVSTQDKSGRIWFGAFNLYGLSINSKLSETQLRTIPTKGAVIFVVVDSGERLWFVPYNDGLYRYDSTDLAWESAESDGTIEPSHFMASDIPTKSCIVPFLAMRDGTIWLRFPDSAHILRFDPAQFTGSDQDSLESIEVELSEIRMIEDSQGRLWILSFNGRLSCWDGKELIALNRNDEKFAESANSILEDDSGNIWIGTKKGIYSYDGKQFVHYGKEHGVGNILHWCSAKDRLGQLWFATRCGVYRTDGRHFQWLTKDDGLPSNAVTGLLPQPDGSMIICTLEGIIRYRSTATLPPPVEIREVIADRIYDNPDEIELTTTSANLLTIIYHSLSLATKRMRYSYILEGYEKEWHETWERQARYENLPIGEYTFRVIAINRDLVASESPAILKLNVIPDPRDVMVNELKSNLELRDQQLIFLRHEMEQKYQFEEIIGESESIRFVRSQMSSVVDSDVDVLITGETGTGKELVARGIHNSSPRRDKMYLPHNCSSIPKELAESILFGHRKGEFTDAKEDRMGLFEIASGGTVVLDEIGDMPIAIQPVLLRVLQERKFRRMGEHRFRELDVRVISITNRDIRKEIKAGRFRDDLYYRLEGFQIFVPPLREREDDIPLLAEYFYQRTCDRLKKELKGFAPGVIDMLSEYKWPGNVRELEHAIEKACILAPKGSQIQTYHFPEIVQNESLAQEIMSERLSYNESVMQFRRQLIEMALQECDGNRTHAAKLLGMERSNLVHLIKDMKLDE